jgi:hypothetical protein
VAGNREPLPTARRAVLTVLLPAVLVLPCLTPTGAAADAASHAHASAKTSAKAKRMSAAQRAKIRRSLARKVRRNPGVLLDRGFLKEAVLVDFKLPMTVRLGRSNGLGGYEPSDDQLEIDWDDSVVPWPLAGGSPPGNQTTLLSGRFTLEASMSDDAGGYGELGAMETVQGANLAMTATPFAISEFSSPCLTSPQLTVPPATAVDVGTTGPRFGLMNLFSQTIRGSLNLRMAFPAALTDACGGTTATTPVVDNSTAPAMPVRFSGTFRMSPAITADGKIRFGRIVVDDAVTPQLSTFSYIRSCVDVVTCNAQLFPARLKLKKLTAEVLLGDVWG